jgi:hypothetical protein
MTSKQKLDLFTAEEHVILAEWLNVPPLCDKEDLPWFDDAMENLGFVGRAIERYDEDAAVASIVLNAIQERLPQWAAVEFDANGNATIHTARRIKKRQSDRIIQLKPQHLITINWANTGPGISWPAAYHLTWVPFYNVNVVTVSTDGPELYGFCDFAIGYFEENIDRITTAASCIASDWAGAAGDCNQPRWTEVLECGLINEEQAKELANEIW